METPAYLSPSSIRTFRDCPQKFKLAYLDRIKEPPKWHLHLGSFVHEVLEHLYQRPADERTIETLREIAAIRWNDHGWLEKVDALEEKKGTLADFKREAFGAMTNLWHIEDPTSTELDGMEHEIIVDIEGVTMKGIIDRFILGDEGVIISDYKTGKIPDPKWAENSDDNKFFQLLAYALMMAESDQEETSHVELLYLTQKTKHTLEVTPARLSIATGTIVETREAIDLSAERGEFHCNVTKLCDWCYYKTSGDCPAFAK